MRYLIIPIAALLTSCESSKTTSDLQAVKNILAQEREAHFARNVDMLFPAGTPDSMLTLSDGSMSYARATDSKKRFAAYFGAVEFVKWDDMKEPVFNFSRDSTLAVVSVQKLVILREKASDKYDTTQYAWTAVYRKFDDGWKMTVMTSTDK